MESISFKRIIIFVLIGAGLGGLFTSWLAPKVIAWYFDPPAQFGVNCKSSIEWALSRFQWSQFIGTLVGITLGFVAAFMLRSKNTEIENTQV